MQHPIGGCTHKDDSNSELREILLEFDATVHGHEDVELSFCQAKQRTIPGSRPAHARHGSNFMPD